MIPEQAAPRRLSFPPFPHAERAPGFPVASSLAPLVAAGAIWALTQSPYALLFAVAAPLAAAGGMLDRRIRRRRSERRSIAAARVALDRLSGEIVAAHDDERALSVGAAHDPAGLASGSAAALWRPGPVLLRLGRADVPSRVELPPPTDPPPALRDEVDRLLRVVARLPDAAVDIDAPAVGVVGPSPMREAVVRSLALQLCAASDPAGTTISGPVDEDWVRALPHRVSLDPGTRGFEFRSAAGLRRLVGAEDSAGLPPALDAVVRVASGGEAGVVVRGRRLPQERLALTMTSRAGAALVAARLAEAAATLETGTPLPVRVELHGLGAAEHSHGLSACIGVGRSGPVRVDLVADGPHAVIGGISGSGKSETLVAWILSMSERRTPDQVTFLLIDFKGGSSFARLSALPHVVGVVSDLDAPTARRATVSLRSEMLRRERLLADAGVGDLGELRGTPRLVIVVDEYAALVAEQPELHETIADLASRGRSLGLHLILCTQRPGGVIREQVLANAGLRICLRVNNRADSLAVLGTDEAAGLAGRPPGRAFVLDASGETRELQCAIAGSADADRIAAAAAGLSTAPFRPWAEPLPETVRAATLEPVPGGVALGTVDLPEQQRTALATYVPARDGNLLCVGGRRAGTTTALATIAAGLGESAVVVPRDLPDAWGVLTTLLDDGSPVDGRVVLLDDVDLLLDGAEEDVRPGLVRLIAALGRALPSRGGALVLGASRPLSAAAPLLSRIDARLLLALPDREQHVLAGGERSEWTPRTPPGRGRWHGREVQVAISDVPLVPFPWEPPAFTPAPTTSIVASDPDRIARALGPAGLRTVPPGDPPAGGAVVLGDPDQWTASWGALDSVRRTGVVLLVGCTASDLRTLFRIRSDPPPLDPHGWEGWTVRGRRVERVRVVWPE